MVSVWQHRWVNSGECKNQKGEGKELEMGTGAEWGKEEKVEGAVRMEGEITWKFRQMKWLTLYHEANVGLLPFWGHFFCFCLLGVLIVHLFAKYTAKLMMEKQ